jgi:hypothetical protein
MLPRPLRGAATVSGLAAVAALALPAFSAPAQAAGHDGIKYVSVKSCKTHENIRPCGPWRLEMHSGTERLLSDALVNPIDRHGKAVKDLTAPIAVSGDGQSVAYFRKRDHRLVVRELGGPVHVMGKDALPKKADMASVQLHLSQYGDSLAVEFDQGEPTRVYDVSRGLGPGKIPGAYSVLNLSRDGETVLVAQYTPDNTTRLLTFDAEGHELSRVEPPQVVANNAPLGLSEDGTMAAFFSGVGPKSKLRLYDMRADSVFTSIKVKLGSTDSPEAIDWTGDHEITAHIPHLAESGRTSMRILVIDTETGTIKVRDSYRVKADSYFFAACGA